MAVVTPYFFITKYSKVAGSSPKVFAMTEYLSELMLLDAETYLPFPCNIRGAAAVALARHTLGVPAWPQGAVQFSGLEVDDFKECLVNLHETFSHAKDSSQQAIREKYKQDRYITLP